MDRATYDRKIEDRKMKKRILLSCVILSSIHRDEATGNRNMHDDSCRFGV
jgi:hypothetical protein